MDNEVSAIFGRHMDAPCFHHCMPVAGVEYGTIRPDRSLSSPDFLPAYEWLEQEIGFFPLFIAVGRSDEVIRMSGYTDNWRLFVGCEGGIKKYRRKGEFPNLALFSFRNVDGVFMDYVDWHIALNACMNGHQVSPFGKRRIFKPYWKKHRWIQAALQGTHLVQMVIPELPLAEAVEGKVRNRSQVEHLERLGFSHVSAARLRVSGIGKRLSHVHNKTG